MTAIFSLSLSLKSDLGVPFDFECEKKLLHNAPQICVHLYFNFVSLALNIHLNVAFFVKRLYSFFFEKKKKEKRTYVWQLLSHVPWYSWISLWVPPARTGARKL